jgi:hypothetical protein
MIKLLVSQSRDIVRKGIIFKDLCQKIHFILQLANRYLEDCVRVIHFHFEVGEY